MAMLNYDVFEAFNRTVGLDTVVDPGDGALITVPAGGRLQIVDLHGNQAIDTLFFDAHDYANRYSAVDTIAALPPEMLIAGRAMSGSAGPSTACRPWTSASSRWIRASRS